MYLNFNFQFNKGSNKSEKTAVRSMRPKFPWLIWHVKVEILEKQIRFDYGGSQQFPAVTF